MLLFEPYFLAKKGHFVLFFKSLFVYFDYFIFLSVFRVFAPFINNIRTICDKFDTFSSFFSSKILSVIFLRRSHPFFPASGLVLYSNTLFSLRFLKELVPILLLKANLLGILAKKYFLNVSSLNVEQLFLYYTQIVEKAVYFNFVIFFISNFLLGLFLTFDINLIRLNF